VSSLFDGGFGCSRFVVFGFALTLAILHEKLNHVYRDISTLGFSFCVCVSILSYFLELR
jgi:hypothetical protein